jgi:hypothetical protein
MVEVFIPPTWMATIKKLAHDRHKLHEGHASSRPLSDDYELIGFCGEYAFHNVAALMADWTRRPGGDNGVDFQVGRLSIDVKTAKKANNLILEEGKDCADIIVLAGMMADYQTNKGERFVRVKFHGWERKEKILAAPTKDFGYGIINHYIPKEDLRPFPELIDAIDKWKADIELARCGARKRRQRYSRFDT